MSSQTSAEDFLRLCIKSGTTQEETVRVRRRELMEAQARLKISEGREEQQLEKTKPAISLVRHAEIPFYSLRSSPRTTFFPRSPPGKQASSAFPRRLFRRAPCGLCL